MGHVNGKGKVLHEANNCNNLDNSKDEFGLAIALDAKHIYRNNGY